jgi:hypothetical protein
MTHQGTTYDFHISGEAVSVEHMGPDGLSVRDGLVYPDKVQDSLPPDVVAVARRVLAAVQVPT